MSSRENVFNRPIRIIYQPPSGLIYFLTLSHLGAIICLFSASVPIWPASLLGLMTLFSYGYYGYLYCDAKENPTEFILHPGGEWSSPDALEGNRDLWPAPGAFVHPNLVVIRLQTPNGRRISLLLTPGNCDPDVLRRIRVRLRYQPAP